MNLLSMRWILSRLQDVSVCPGTGAASGFDGELAGLWLFILGLSSSGSGQPLFHFKADNSTFL